VVWVGGVGGEGGACRGGGGVPVGGGGGGWGGVGKPMSMDSNLCYRLDERGRLFRGLGYTLVFAR